MEDSRGALCRIGCLAGTDERVHRRRAGRDRMRERRSRASPRPRFDFLAMQMVWIARVGLEAGPLSQWLHAGLIAAGFDAVLLETRHVKAALVGDDGEDRPARCARHRPAAAAWLVSAGARQVGERAGGARAADCPQAHPGQAARHRERHSRGAARVRPQGRPDQPRSLRSTDPRACRWPCDARDRDRRRCSPPAPRCRPSLHVSTARCSRWSVRIPSAVS